MKALKYTTAVSALAVFMSLASAGHAAQGDEDNSNSVLNRDIIVTADRREVNIQDVAVAVSAFSGDQLQAMNIQDATRIVDMIPNFKAGGLGGPSGPPMFSIRGVSFVDFSTINEASVGVYVDEVYQAAQGAGVAQTYDMERVEVLRGPQGTLFGRNTTAGVVHYLTRKAKEDYLNGNFGVQYGQNNQVIVDGALGGGITEGFRGRVAFKYNRDDGWQENVVTGKGHAKTNAFAIRGNFQVDMSDTSLLELGVHYGQNRGIAVGLRPYWIYGSGVADPASPTGFRPTTYCGGFTSQFQPDTPNDLARAACLLGNKGVSRSGYTTPAGGWKASKIYSDRDNEPFEYTAYGAYLKLTADLDWANFTNVGAYERYEQLFEYDYDGWDNRPYGTGQVEQATHWDSYNYQWSEEARLDGDYNGNKWVLGAFFYSAKQSVLAGTTRDTAGPADFLRTSTTPIRYTTKTRSFAFFGQVDTPITDTVTLSVGARYTHDRRELLPLDCQYVAVAPFASTTTKTQCLLPTAEPVISGGALSGRMALEWRPGDDQLYYASYSHGFKSGGFNSTANPAQRGPVGEETIDNYELGMKQQFFDRRLRVNATAFYYKFKGLQALIGTQDNIGTPIVLYINAGNPRAFGGELELAASLTDNLEISLGAAVLDTKISADPLFKADGRTLDGKKLPQAPDFSMNAIVRYTVPLGDSGTLNFQADGRYQTAIYTGVDNDPAEYVPAYGIANVRIGWQDADKKLKLEAFVDNVFNKNVVQHIFSLTNGSYTTNLATNTNLANPSVTAPDAGFGVWGRPRLWGVRAGYSF